MLCPALSRHGIKIADYDDLTSEQKRAAREYFERMVFPVCTPLAVDPGHPFPHISNLSLNLAVELQDPDGRAPLRPREGAQRLPRLVPLPISLTKRRMAKQRLERRPDHGTHGCYSRGWSRC